MTICGTFPPARTSICLARKRQHLGATGDAFLTARALMDESPVPIIPFAGDFVPTDDERLFAFIASLRKSVSAKVTAGQRRGLSLSEIVVEVREMVRFAEEDPDLPSPFPPNTYKAISRQAVAWSIEAYQPLVFTGGNALDVEPTKLRTP